MSFSNPHYRIKRWSVVGMEGMWAKMFDPPTASPATPDEVAPTNPVPEVMAAAGYLNVATPHTVERDLMHGVNMPTWDNRPGGMNFMLIREAGNPAAVGNFPGPTIRVPRGVVFHATTLGHGPPPHTIHWHGLEPTPMNDGVGHCSMEIGNYTYQFQPNFIGSYFYHCHRNTVQHFEFGLYGFFIVDPPDTYFATRKNPAIPIGHCRDGKRRTAGNTSAFPEFPGFNNSLITASDPLGEYPVHPHAMTIEYEVEALWVFDDRDSRWSDMAKDPRATYPKFGSIPGVNDEFHRNPAKNGFFAFNDFHADYWYVTGVPVPAPKGSTGTIPTGVVIPPELMSGVSGTQVSINAKVNQTILLRCLNGAYDCVEVTFPVDIVIIAWDGRALGVPPYGAYNHAYKVPKNTPFRLSVARRFDALIRSAVPIDGFATVKFINTRGEVGGANNLSFDVLPTNATPHGSTIQPGEVVAMTAQIPINIGPTNPVVATFGVSGTVTDQAGAPTRGVSVRIEPVSLGGTAGKTVTTDASGDYSISGLVPSMYEITPSKAGMTFEPPSAQVTISDANATIPAFVAVVTIGDISLDASKPSPQPAGIPVTFNASVNGGIGPFEYRFKLNGTIVKDYSSSSSWTWDTAGKAPGDYTVKVDVRKMGMLDGLHVTLSEKSASISYAVSTEDITYNSIPNDYTLGEAIDSLKMTVGVKQPTPADFARMDVAPLINGIKQPDGKIDLQDVIVILRKVVGLPL